MWTKKVSCKLHILLKTCVLIIINLHFPLPKYIISPILLPHFKRMMINIWWNCHLEYTITVFIHFHQKWLVLGMIHSQWFFCSETPLNLQFSLFSRRYSVFLLIYKVDRNAKHKWTTHQPFKRQFHKMVKHTLKIRRQIAYKLFECVSSFCGIGA